MIDLTKIAKDMEVVGSDGQHVGTVDKLAIKTTRKDPAANGQHHIINIELAGSVEDGKLVLTVPAAEAMTMQKALAS